MGNKYLRLNYWKQFGSRNHSEKIEKVRKRRLHIVYVAKNMKWRSRTQARQAKVWAMQAHSQLPQLGLFWYIKDVAWEKLQKSKQSIEVKQYWSSYLHHGVNCGSKGRRDGLCVRKGMKFGVTNEIVCLIPPFRSILGPAVFCVLSWSVRETKKGHHPCTLIIPGGGYAVGRTPLTCIPSVFTECGYGLGCCSRCWTKSSCLHSWSLHSKRWERGPEHTKSIDHWECRKVRTEKRSRAKGLRGAVKGAGGQGRIFHFK